MELHVIEREGRETVVLLDNEMRIVKPVYDYLKFQRQKNKAFNTLKIGWKIILEKENVVDSILCKRSNKCLFYNTFIHTIQSATKNNIWRKL